MTRAGPGRSAVTIGAFDGVHVGHRRLIADVVGEARASGLRSVVVTFDRHPATIVRPGSAPLLLTDVDQKQELLEATGVDEVLVLVFDEVRAAEPADEFVEEMLVGRLAARKVIVGRDFHFGSGRKGNVDLLVDMGRSFDFEVIEYELVADGAPDAVVSSTRIRGLVSSGELEEASRLLGRDFELRGRVDPFAGRDGGPLSFAVPEGMILPRAGRYEGSLQLGGGVADGVEIDVPGPVGLRPSALLLRGLTVVTDPAPAASAASAPATPAPSAPVPARLRFFRPLAEHAGPEPVSAT